MHSPDRRWVVFALTAGLARSAMGQRSGNAAADAASATELRLALNTVLAQPLDVGQRVELPMILAYRNAPPKSRIYAHVITLRGERWITPGGALISAMAPTFNFAGNFVDGDRSGLRIAADNYPISVLIKSDVLAKAFGQFLGDAKAAAEMAEGLGNSKDGYELSLAFLAATKHSDGVEQVKLSFTVPDYGHHFDGLLIAPFVLTYNPDDSQSVRYVGVNTKTLQVPVQPNRPEPAPEKPKPQTEIPGSASIIEFRPRNVTLATGVPNLLELRVTCRDLLPGTAVYVVALPTAGERYLFGAMSMAVSAIRKSGLPEIREGALPKDAGAPSRTFAVALFGDVTVEAAFVGVLPRGGSGEVEGKVSVTPPAYARRYDRLHLIPVLVVPTDDGLRYLFDNMRLTGPKLLVSEG